MIRHFKNLLIFFVISIFTFLICNQKNNSYIASSLEQRVKFEIERNDSLIDGYNRDIKRIRRMNNIREDEKQMQIRKLKNKINSKERETKRMKKRIRQIVS